MFYQGRCLVLKIDGSQHQQQRERGYARDRVLLRENIATVRFTAQECMTKTSDVVAEFLAIFKSILFHIFCYSTKPK